MVLPTPVVLPDVLQGPAIVPVVPDVPGAPVAGAPVPVVGLVPMLPLLEGIGVVVWEGVVVVVVV